LPDDPAPDLVIEIDITRSSLDKMAIYAAMAVREVWRYNGSEVRFFELGDLTYAQCQESGFLRGLTPADVTRFLDRARSGPRAVWLEGVREWAARQKAK
jgi:hypothetical protein